jgi:hypothetical protein
VAYAHRRYRKLRPEVEAMPWGTLDIGRFDEQQLMAARLAWTSAAFQEHRTGIASRAIRCHARCSAASCATRQPMEPSASRFSIGRCLSSIRTSARWSVRPQIKRFQQCARCGRTSRTDHRAWVAGASQPTAAGGSAARPRAGRARRRGAPHLARQGGARRPVPHREAWELMRGVRRFSNSASSRAFRSMTRRLASSASIVTSPKN